MRSNAETAEIDAQLIGNWVGKYPYLRLIHCIVDNDDIKDAFIHRNKTTRGRSEIENRNHTVSVWSKIADTWNNPSDLPAVHFSAHQIRPTQKTHTNTDLANAVYPTPPTERDPNIGAATCTLTSGQPRVP